MEPSDPNYQKLFAESVEKSTHLTAPEFFIEDMRDPNFDWPRLGVGFKVSDGSAQFQQARHYFRVCWIVFGPFPGADQKVPFWHILVDGEFSLDRHSLAYFSACLHVAGIILGELQ